MLQYGTNTHYIAHTWLVLLRADVRRVVVVEYMSSREREGEGERTSIIIIQPQKQIADAENEVTQNRFCHLSNTFTFPHPHTHTISHITPNQIGYSQDEFRFPYIGTVRSSHVRVPVSVWCTSIHVSPEPCTWTTDMSVVTCYHLYGPMGFGLNDEQRHKKKVAHLRRNTEKRERKQYFCAHIYCRYKVQTESNANKHHVIEFDSALSGRPCTRIVCHLWIECSFSEGKLISDVACDLPSGHLSFRNSNRSNPMRITSVVAAQSTIQCSIVIPIHISHDFILGIRTPHSGQY